MNIIAGLSVSYIYCIINNILIINSVIKKLYKRGFIVEFDLKNPKLKKFILKEIIINIIPILNMLHSLKVTVNYMNNESGLIKDVEEVVTSKKVSYWEQSHTKRKSTSLGIIYNHLKYKKMMKRTKNNDLISLDINTDNIEPVKSSDDFIISNQYVEPLEYDELKLVRKKKNKPKHK